jgi:hypothetical protein
VALHAIGGVARDSFERRETDPPSLPRRLHDAVANERVDVGVRVAVFMQHFARVFAEHGCGARDARPAARPAMKPAAAPANNAFADAFARARKT